MVISLLYILAPLFGGYLIKVKTPKTLEIINKKTTWLILFILCLMGMNLAALDNIADNFSQILKLTSVFFISITFLNFLILALLDLFFKTKTKHYKKSPPKLLMIFESMKLLFVVVVGFLLGLISPYPLDWIPTATEIVLFVLLALIGIQLRNSGLTLKQIILNKKGMLVAFLIVATSFLGGAIAALLLNIPIKHGLAMASGFGWYSLSGILIGDMLGPIYGGAALLLDLTRELVAISIIPIIIGRFPLTAIGYAGATSMDFALPIIQTSGGVHCVPIAIVSGFILSLLTPIFILSFAV